jgi:hypothetical protein
MIALMFPARICLLIGLSAVSVLAQPVPDFSLPDVNAGSPRTRTMVSPRDYLLQVSGYYFGQAH